MEQNPSQGHLTTSASASSSYVPLPGHPQPPPTQPVNGFVAQVAPPAHHFGAAPRRGFVGDCSGRMLIGRVRGCDSRLHRLPALLLLISANDRLALPAHVDYVSHTD
ncbi:hypothetical protein PAAG_06855 [Paracoccidioides lutzii Pb01]|uniref:Uncharacterized protein n=1 Tax=Paracoccidioides lutzii (strain ATCC MYA-826 / Pb01) TaxID=502779 RepID=C1H7W4_PARBA|nr:hypothetical protein PAAG_06855 [Paracoccidioides lutzii Pb01]EEH36437.2 hypothetical protein PAAG_06855 [Paracoccidioides lutzii Pb01]